MRLFIGLMLSLETRKALEKVQTIALNNAFSKNPTLLDNFHLTLCFLGDTAIESIDQIVKSIESAIQSFHSFRIEISQIGSFQKGQEYIVFANIVKGHKILVDLSERIRQTIASIPLPYVEDEFVPHITLARRVRFPHINMIELPNFEVIHEDINNIVLFESTRIHNTLTYLPIKIIPLNQF